MKELKAVPHFPRHQLFSLVYNKQEWQDPSPFTFSPFTMLLWMVIITYKMSFFNANSLPVYCGPSCQGHKGDHQNHKSWAINSSFQVWARKGSPDEITSMCVNYVFWVCSAHLLSLHPCLSSTPHKKDKQIPQRPLIFGKRKKNLK